jgi:hypothetical protein
VQLATCSKILTPEKVLAQKLEFESRPYDIFRIEILADAFLFQFSYQIPIAFKSEPLLLQMIRTVECSLLPNTLVILRRNSSP